MKADISAHTFRPDARFAAVVVGQGQVLLDSALNEQEEIARARLDATAADVIGPAGVPKGTGGFEVTVAPDGRDLLISPGRLYVDGILCVNEPPAVPATVGTLPLGIAVLLPTSLTVLRPHVAAPGGVPFAAGQWVDVPAGGGAAARSQVVGVQDGQLLLFPPLPAAPVEGGRVEVRPVTSLRHQSDRPAFDPFDPATPDRLTPGAWRVEVDAWHRHVTAVEDPSIQEAALGDAESPSRLKAVWQLRLEAAGPAGASPPPGPATPPGRLAASTVGSTAADEAGVLPDEAGYRGLENQLYRVEVHSATATDLVLKWQRDNASTVTRVESLGKVLGLADLGRDDERGFATAPYVEVTDDTLELEGRPSDLLKVVDADPTLRTVTLAAAPTLAQPGRRPRARRWDGRIAVDLESPASAAPVTLERGLHVTLLPGALRPGDYWLVPARAAHGARGGTIGWPTDDAGAPLAQPPLGITHHRATLAFVDADASRFVGGAAGTRDQRAAFPPLTAITAADVSTTPGSGGLGGVTNVQQALDVLAVGGHGLCTVIATPGPGWERVFDAVPAGASARIGFPVGQYPTAGPVLVAGRGHLVLVGAGHGAAVVAAARAALVFDTCASVRVESLSVISTGTSPADRGLAGALTFQGCGDVSVSRCLLGTAPRPGREAACLRVAGGGRLRVEDSTFEVGDRQVGLLATDVEEAVVTGNRLTVSGRAGGGARVQETTAQERILLRRLLVYNLSKVTCANPGRHPVRSGATPMSCATVVARRPAGRAVLRPSYSHMRDFRRDLDRVLRGVFAGRLVAGAEPIVEYIEKRVLARQVPVMAQGIVVTPRADGANARRRTDARIASNVIEPAIQGVHVGGSMSGPRATSLVQAGRVAVTDNKIHVVVPPEGAGARHGIFVGSADRLRVTSNDISCAIAADFSPVPTNGIRVFGFSGSAMTVRDNVTESFPEGLGVNLLPSDFPPPPGTHRMWAVEDNLFLGAKAPASVTAPYQTLVKFRGNRPGPPDN
ncbi:hypothetical protein I6A84_18685 [Frankia sp. CNm7]|uniref:DUF6519 domain-containing protein n=1 Tax=Frankia nepalensis TaxID=1836974 RepID=UPI0019320936|nr:DUF6519 domain-containing protein [Frankia nepalensis]MBL7520062.1 hypothetical protein [Frankia nepalensis]